MDQSERSLTTFGRRVAALQDQAKEAQLDLDRGRARLLDTDLPAASAPARRRSAPAFSTLRGARRAAWLLVAAALALVVLGVALWTRPRASLRFELAEAVAGVVGDWIAAPSVAALPIRFSDGSRLILAAGGRARVVAVNDDGAEIALESGALDLSVVHRDHTRWSVRVGPFHIRVVGTRFETRWDPVAERFDVALREGAITVSGPIVGELRAVRAGERLTVSPATGTLTLGPIDTDSTPSPSVPVSSAGSVAPSVPVSSANSVAPSAPARALAVADAEVPLARRRRGAAAPVAQPADQPSAPSWRALARGARYKAALVAAEQEGFDATCAAASASDLRALGDVARLAGSPSRAEQAFNALRQRFPGSPESASAAFILGRIAQDQRRDYAGAAAYFNRYLSEQPAGGFAADAAGRLVEVEDKRGDEASARRAAARYLAAYPNGAHAAYARSVLARGSTPTSRMDTAPSSAATMELEER